MRKLLPGIVAAVVASSLSVAFANGGFAMLKGAPTEEEIVALIEENGVGGIYHAMDRYFPEDAAAWREDLSDLIVRKRSGGYDAASGLEIGAQLRRKYAPHLAAAPDDQLRRVIRHQFDLYAVFKDRPSACGAFLVEGPAGLTRAQRQELVPALQDADIVFKAMHSGLTSPVRRASASDADWSRLFELLLSRGLTAADIDVIAAADPANPRYCDTYLAFLDTLATARFTGADRLRADLAAGMYAS